MWTTIMTTAIAGAVSLSLISLATELKKDGVIDPPVVGHFELKSKAS